MQPTALEPSNHEGRRAVPGLRTPFPMVRYTPAMLAEDPIVQELLETLDEVLAPIINTLDCFDTYLDPRLAPMDFVQYLSSWLLVTQEDGWDEETRRTALALAIERSRWRGTAHGIRARLQSLFGMESTVTDSGSVTVGRDFTDPAAWPDAPPPSVTIRLDPGHHLEMGLDAIKASIASVLPAHATVTIEQGT